MQEKRWPVDLLGKPDQPSLGCIGLTIFDFRTRPLQQSEIVGRRFNTSIYTYLYLTHNAGASLTSDPK